MYRQRFIINYLCVGGSAAIILHPGFFHVVQISTRCSVFRDLYSFTCINVMTLSNFSDPIKYFFTDLFTISEAHANLVIKW